MCDTYAKWDPSSQPIAKLFEHENCGGRSYDLIADGKINDFSVSPYPNFGVTSLVVAPYSYLDITDRPFPEWKADGTWGYRARVYYGTHPNIGNNNWPTNTSTPRPAGPIGWNDNVRGVYHGRFMPWSQYSLNCCTRTDASQNCPSFYGPNSNQGCDQYMMQYCSTVGNMDNAICREWYLPNKERETLVKRTVCSTGNMNNAGCRAWCRQNSGQCDTAASTWCKANPKDTICNCLTSPVTKYNPACVDPLCIAGKNDTSEGIGGYVTASMKSMACPNIVDCSTQIELQAGDRLTTGGVNVAQNCGANADTTGTTTTTTPTGTTTTTTTPPVYQPPTDTTTQPPEPVYQPTPPVYQKQDAHPAPLSAYKNLMIMIVLIVLAIIGGIGFVKFMRARQMKQDANIVKNR